MNSNKWKKVENEAGYPCYVEEATGEQHYDHPEFKKIIETLDEFDGIKYSVYRVAFKIFALQRQLKDPLGIGCALSVKQSLFRVLLNTWSNHIMNSLKNNFPPLRISSGVFARHQLSLSESSLSLDTAELEAVLADIYFAAEKDGLFTGDVDLAVDLLINLLLNVYDEDRKEPIRVLAAKTLLILLSEESVIDQWLALANCCADHNGCVSPKRLAALLAHVAALARYLGSSCDQTQDDVDACFDKSAGMLGVSARAVAEWGSQRGARAAWLAAAQRLRAARAPRGPGRGQLCAKCQHALVQVLKFKCSKCNEVYFCEKCYLYDKDLTTVRGHKKTHLVHEIIDEQIKSTECLSFMKGMKRFFFCTKTKKKRPKKGSKKSVDKVDGQASVRKRRVGKPAMFTSTVGKASGNSANNPTCMLQDIITQLETQNKALKDVSTQLLSDAKSSENEELRLKVVAHWTHISTQISRLKLLKENLTTNSQNVPPEELKSEKNERPQAFDLFSPIPIIDENLKVTELKNQPRVLSMDSGNFSVVSKHENLMTVSGDALKPVVVHATSDSISTVSMNDISNWYNDTESHPEKRSNTTKLRPVQTTISPDTTRQSLCAAEQKFAADIRSVENSNDKMRELNADLDTVLDRLQQILTNNFATDDSCFDNTQLRETATEMEGLLGTLIPGVEQRATLNATKGLV